MFKSGGNIGVLIQAGCFFDAFFVGAVLDLIICICL